MSDQQFRAFMQMLEAVRQALLAVAPARTPQEIYNRIRDSDDSAASAMEAAFPDA